MILSTIFIIVCKMGKFGIKEKFVFYSTHIVIRFGKQNILMVLLSSPLYIYKIHELLAMKSELFVKGISILMPSYKE